LVAIVEPLVFWVYQPEALVTVVLHNYWN